MAADPSFVFENASSRSPVLHLLSHLAGKRHKCDLVQTLGGERFFYHRAMHLHQTQSRRIGSLWILLTPGFPSSSSSVA